MRFSSSSDTPGPKSSCAFWMYCAKEPPEHISWVPVMTLRAVLRIPREHHRVSKTRKQLDLEIWIYLAHSACASHLPTSFGAVCCGLSSIFMRRSCVSTTCLLRYDMTCMRGSFQKHPKALSGCACAIPKNKDCGSFRGTWTAFELVSWCSMVTC